MRIAIIILIVLVLLYLLYHYKENLTDSAQAKALLKYQISANPGSFSDLVYMENLENKNENPALIAMLYR